MATSSRPIVYISYRWINIEHDGRPARAPDPEGLALADDLRARGLDVRLDLYFHESRHGFSPPERVAGDPRDPWLVWAVRQIEGADVVLMLCTPAYVRTDPDGGSESGEWARWCELGETERVASRVPALWWDWLAISRECNLKPEKFIPVGRGPISR
jgi:hypothetical protein